MFGNSNNRNHKGGSFINTMVNIATIVSTTVTCIRLTFYGILSVQTSALIMLGVVVFVALGSNIAKIVLAGAALILFVLLYSHGNSVVFSQLMTQMLTLILVLVGLYIMVRSIFKRK